MPPLAGYALSLEPADLQLHECRHSFKTFLEDAGIRESRVDRNMGHADHTVQDRYSRPSPKARGQRPD